LCEGQRSAQLTFSDVANAPKDVDFAELDYSADVNEGHSGNVSLDGIKIWIAGDLGADFSKGAEWAEITFEPAVKKSSGTPSRLSFLTSIR
jgi:hypothetical protein